MDQLGWQKVLIIGRVYTWKASGLHKGIARGKKECL